MLTTFSGWSRCCRAFLKEIRSDSLLLPNCDLDSGKPAAAAEYSLTDDT
jgi:hypothetical protein